MVNVNHSRNNNGIRYFPPSYNSELSSHVNDISSIWVWTTLYSNYHLWLIVAVHFKLRRSCHIMHKTAVCVDLQDVECFQCQGDPQIQLCICNIEIFASQLITLLWFSEYLVMALCYSESNFYSSHWFGIDKYGLFVVLFVFLNAIVVRQTSRGSSVLQGKFIDIGAHLIPFYKLLCLLRAPLRQIR